MDPEVRATLRRFVEESGFARRGAVITDLDGTALHQQNGSVLIAKPVELGLKRLYELGRPFVLNSLRSPLSILRSFGRDWYRISNAPIPAVTCNGALLGCLVEGADASMGFEEWAAFPLSQGEIDAAVGRISGLLARGIRDLLLFSFPRDWRVRESIWTPQPELLESLKARYLRAAAVAADDLAALRGRLYADEVCMLYLLENAPEPQGEYISPAGVDKLTGARQMAERLGFDPAASIAAGDTDMDRFLAGAGLAVLVGDAPLAFHGLHATVRLRDSLELGELLFETAALIADYRRP